MGPNGVPEVDAVVASPSAHRGVGKRRARGNYSGAARRGKRALWWQRHGWGRVPSVHGQFGCAPLSECTVRLPHVQGLPEEELQEVQASELPALWGEAGHLGG